MKAPVGIRELSCDEVREMAGAYVLQALDLADEASVRAHLAFHPDAHPEVAELGSVIPTFFEMVPVVEPPEGLKARIMAAAEADRAARSTPRDVAPNAVSAAAARAGRPGIAVPATPPVAFPSAAERAARRATTPAGTWLLRIAAVLTIALLGGWNLLLQSDLGAARRYEQSVAAVLESAAKPGTLTALLTADGGTGSGLAAVDAHGDLAMAMRDLAPTAGDTVYEAWVIARDGVPVPLGSFVVGSSGTAYFEAGGLPPAAGIVLALTREPGPGATAPTLPIISKGVATSPG